MNTKFLNIKKLEPLERTRKKNSKVWNYEVIGIDNKYNKTLKGKINEVLIILKGIHKGKIIVPIGIFKCASSYYPKYFGYEWEFLNEEDKNKFNIFKSFEAKTKLLNLNDENKRKLVAYDLLGNPVEAFENIFDAINWLKNEKNIKIDYRSILNVAKNYQNPKKAKTARGFRWRFFDDVIVPNI